MNYRIRTAALGLGLICAPAMAANPVNGFYAGLLGNINHTPNLSFNVISPITNLPVKATVDYTSVGGGGALQLGYRWCDNWRAEIEGAFQGNTINRVTLGNISLSSIKNNPGFHIYSSHTYFFGALVNGYYDFLSVGDDSVWGPYVGLGLGYGIVQNTVKVYNNTTLLSGNLGERNNSTGVAQGIIGASYFVDDFTTLGMDVRYLAGNNIKALDSRYQVVSLNFVINAGFDGGGN